ncbi:Outer membrane efflux protein BepC precursor [Rickettsiales bacterium Ac37b]|nr:Outer membrane efflux protein BepC precursor [Rickettsiales bacterium Ac37b]
MSRADKTIINLFFSVITVILLSNSSYAKSSDPAQPIDLFQALTHTYNNNPNLQEALEQLKAAGTNVYKASAEFLPSIAAGIDRGRDYQNIKVKNIPSNQLNGPISADSIQVKQPIFSSGSSVFGVKASKKAFFANVASFYNTEQQVLLSAIQAYIGVLYAKESLDINIYNVQMLAKALQYAEERFEVGDATRSDVAESKSQLSSALASKAQAEGDYEIAKAKYKQVIGIEPANLAMIQEINNLPLNLRDLVEIASNNHPVVISARLNMDSKKDLLVRSKLGILPSASINASVARQDNNTLNNAAQRVIQKVIDKKVMLNVQIPIYQSGLEYMAVRNSKIEVQGSKYTLQKSREQVIEGVIEAWNKLSSYKEAFKSSSDAVDAASIALDSMKQEEEVGTRTLLDVLEAEQKLFQAKLRLSNVKYSKVLSTYTLKASVGDLTAQKLKLPVKVFDTNAYYNKAKKQLIGFSEE